MNITFICDSTQLFEKTLIPWRGVLFFDSLRKSGVHNVEIIDSTSINSGDWLKHNNIESSDIILIEGSSNIDLLNFINFWKSHGKIVIIDMPIYIDPRINQEQTSDNKISFINNPILQKKIDKNYDVNNKQKRDWGFHLADAILLSSPIQQQYWQSTSLLYVIPDYINLESIRNSKRIKSKSFNVGVFFDSRNNYFNNFSEVIADLNNKYASLCWFSFFDKENELKLPSTYNVKKENYFQILASLDIGITLSKSPTSIINSRIPLELMSLRIPWITNCTEWYEEFSKYGIKISNNEEIQRTLSYMIDHFDLISSDLDDQPYFYSLSRNIDDHTYEIISVFNDIIKVIKT